MGANFTMSKKPTISAVMGVCNGARFLVECIESVLSQTHEDFEFIIINDGSTDNTQDVLETMRSHDKRIRIFKQSNQGLTKTLNRAIKLANSKYIARVDDGGICHEDRLKAQLMWLEKNKNAAATGSYYDVVDKSSKILRRHLPPSKHPQLKRIAYAGVNPFAHGAMMIRSSVFKKLNYRKQFQFAQDYDLWLQILDEGLEITNTPRVLYKHRILPGDFKKRPQQKYFADLALQMSKNRRAGMVDVPSEQDLNNIPKRKLTSLEARALYYKNFKQ